MKIFLIITVLTMSAIHATSQQDSVRVQVADSLQGITAITRSDTLSILLPKNVRVVDTVYRKFSDQTRGRVTLDTVESRYQQEIDPYLAIGPVLNVVSMSGLPGVPSCCPSYTTTWGYRGALGLNVYSRMSTEWSWLANGEIGHGGVTFTATEPTTLIVQGIPTAANLQHSLSTSFTHVGLGGGFRFKPGGALAVSFVGAIDAYVGTSYSQQEQLENAEALGRFVDSKSDVRNVFSGAIESSVTLRPRLELRIGARLPLDTFGRTSIVPTLSYVLQPTTPVSGVAWSTHSIALGIAASFGTTDEYDVIMGVDSASSIIPEETKKPIVRITPEGTWTQGGIQRHFKGLYRTEPLLPYVFFDEASSALPNRYVTLRRDSANARSLQNILLPEAPLSAYYNLLNIVGLRLQQRSESTITITGCNQDKGREQGDTALSRKRAEAVRDYLVTSWNIPRSRIKIASRNLPSSASVYRDENAAEDAQAENRRVELYSDDPAILAEQTLLREVSTTSPAVIDVAVSLSSVPDSVNVAIAFKGRKGRLDTSLVVRSSGDTTLQVQVATNSLPRVGAQDTTLDAVLSVNQPDGRVLVDAVRIPYSPRVASTTESFLSLLLFDYGSTQLSARSIEVLQDYALGIDSTARVSIVGYTDRIGDSELNRKLSLDRATAVWNTLGITRASVVGKGEDGVLYGNDLPEARFYNRTVQITVTTDE